MKNLVSYILTVNNLSCFRWKVYTQRNNSSHTNVQEFDKFMVATGPFRSALMPDIPGMKEFKGQMMHIKDYRQQSISTGKRVLVVGKDSTDIYTSVGRQKQDNALYIKEKYFCNLNIFKYRSTYVLM